MGQSSSVVDHIIETHEDLGLIPSFFLSEMGIYFQYVDSLISVQALYGCLLLLICKDGQPIHTCVRFQYCS